MIGLAEVFALGWEDHQADWTTGRVDCRGACRFVYHLAGRDMPLDAFDEVTDAWERVLSLDDTQPLDLLASDPEGKGVATHVSVIVRPGANGTCVSASPRYGGPYAVEPWRVRGLVGIYRLKR